MNQSLLFLCHGAKASVGLHVTLEVRIWIRLQVPLAKTITVDAANGVDLDVQ
jgi:hypothetical protein